ncbi:MAG TPA: hypothetical protein VKQ28_09305 [Candidatus Acidoferrum sp.]|nr:hypothetical protein [Candidatus Acidoferrum sp.]
MTKTTGSHLQETDCLKIEQLFDELSDTVGALTAILELATAKKGEGDSRFVELAKDASERGVLVLKKQLWHWSGVRSLGAQESSLKSPETIIKALQAEIHKTREKGSSSSGPGSNGRSRNDRFSKTL